MTNEHKKAYLMAGYMVGSGVIFSSGTANSNGLPIEIITKACDRFVDESYAHIDWTNTALSYENELSSAIRDELSLFLKNNLQM